MIRQIICQGCAVHRPRNVGNEPVATAVVSEMIATAVHEAEQHRSRSVTGWVHHPSGLRCDLCNAQIDCGDNAVARTTWDRSDGDPPQWELSYLACDVEAIL